MKNLLQEVAKGSSSAFEKLYRQYFKKCFRLALYFLKSEHTAEDVVSEVFMSLWENREKVADIENWDSYLYVTIKNRSIYHAKKNSRLGHESLDVYDFFMASRDLSPVDVLKCKELESIFENAVKSLPERCRCIYEMVRINGFTYKSAATSLNISERTVNAQMVIATKRVREKVSNFYS